MADEIPIASSPAPVSQEPVAVTPQAVAPSPAATPAASSVDLASAPAVETATPATAIVATQPEVPAAPSSILGDATTKEVPKGVAPAEAEAAAPEAPAENVPLPTYEAYALPEGAKLDDASVGKFNELLGRFEQTTGSNHAAVQALAQGIIDMYVAEQGDAATRMQQLQKDTWERVNNQWKDDVKADPQIGGKRYETTIRQAAAVLDRYGQTVGAEREKSLREALGWTGAGNNVEVIRFMNWASRFVTEQTRPVAAIVPKAPSLKSPRSNRYPTLNGAA